MAKSRSASGILTAAIGVSARASNQLVLLCLTLVSTRFLAPAEFGVFALAAAATTLVRTVLYTGAYEYLLKAPDAKSTSTECLIVNAMAAATMSLGLLAFAFTAKRLFGTAELGWVVLALIPSNFIAMITAWQEALLLRGTRIRLYYAITLTTEIFAGVVAVVLFEMGWGIKALIAQTYVRAIVQALAYLTLKPTVLSTRPSLRMVREILNWSLSRYAGVAVGFLSNYSADFLLGAFLSTSASGLYRAGNRIATSVSDLFAQPARTFGVTLFSRQSAEGRSPDELWPKVMIACTALGWPALAGLAAVSGKLIPLALGHKWAAAAPLVSIFCLGKSFGIVSSVTGPLLVAYNHQKLALGLQTAGTVCSVTALFFFARYGVEAALWSGVATGSIMMLAQFGAVLWLFPASGRHLLKALPSVLAPTLATIAGAQLCLQLAPWGASHNKWLLTAAIILAGMLAWAFAALPFRRRIVQSAAALGGG